MGIVKDCSAPRSRANDLFAGNSKATEEHWVHRILSDAHKDKLYFVQTGRVDTVLFSLKPKQKSGTKLKWFLGAETSHSCSYSTVSVLLVFAC